MFSPFFWLFAALASFFSNRLSTGFGICSVNIPWPAGLIVVEDSEPVTIYRGLTTATYLPPFHYTFSSSISILLFDT
ncbi:uncharacterized protein EV420DRAFT_136146 [Desarmillaria tabescens]|uniref:Secreted protein n=1 Tax=Armillaria tabescens TaxID=1929756 RepID=A0AA39NA92_ARMTA|nr:uncharacterized protein EV420DRAFT_136146 [Desarmillaria tabescens]KAK0461916.1 hypothetical protein EV420DRAFT_136146 [Desarmillaria tabescens]